MNEMKRIRVGRGEGEFIAVCTDGAVCIGPKTEGRQGCERFPVCFPDYAEKMDEDGYIMAEVSTISNKPKEVP